MAAGATALELLGKFVTRCAPGFSFIAPRGTNRPIRRGSATVLAHFNTAPVDALGSRLRIAGGRGVPTDTAARRSWTRDELHKRWTRAYPKTVISALPLHLAAHDPAPAVHVSSAKRI
jgi:hypothetical protein